MSETAEQPGQRTKRCPAVTFPAPEIKEQCTILVPEDRATHGGLHRWPNEDWGQLPETQGAKAARTLPEVALTLGVYALTLAFLGFLIAWFTR
jgi:hypothetical protein